MSALSRIISSESANEDAARRLFFQRLRDGPSDIVNEASEKELVQKVRTGLEAILSEQQVSLPEQELKALNDQVAEELMELGPLAIFLNDPTIVEIMVIGPLRIYIAPQGVQQLSPLQFRDEAHLRQVVDHIVEPLGYTLDRDHPLLEFRLPDGSRLNAVIPPIAVDGTLLTIRRMSKTPLTVQNIIDDGAATAGVMEFLRACVIADLNILVSGGGSSGKTTLLNILCGFIPSDERIITIEHTRELMPGQPHVARMEARRPRIQGEGEVTLSDLLVHAHHMMADRIIVGDLYGGEAHHFLFLMTTGCDGAMASLHANSPRDALSSLETKCLMADSGYPVRAVRQEIASTLHLIVQTDRLRDGSRKITRVSEVLGLEGDVVSLGDLFVFEQTGVEDRKILGGLKPTGRLPKHIEMIADAGIELPPEIFGIDGA